MSLNFRVHVLNIHVAPTFRQISWLKQFHIVLGSTKQQPEFCKIAQVVQKVDNAIHQINHYPVNTHSVVCFINTYSINWKVIHPVDYMLSSL